MSIFDIIVLVCIAVALFAGLRKGLIGQVVSLAGVCAGVWLSVKFSAEVGAWLSGWMALDEKLLRVIAFVLIFFVVALGLTLAGRLLEKVIKVVMLGWVNRLLGAVLALVECLLVLCLLLMAFDAINGTFSLVSADTLAGTIFYSPLKEVSYAIFPYLKELFFWK